MRQHVEGGHLHEGLEDSVLTLAFGYLTNSCLEIDGTLRRHAPHLSMDELAVIAHAAVGASMELGRDSDSVIALEPGVVRFLTQANAFLHTQP